MNRKLENGPLVEFTSIVQRPHTGPRPDVILLLRNARRAFDVRRYGRKHTLDAAETLRRANGKEVLSGETWINNPR